MTLEQALAAVLKPHGSPSHGTTAVSWPSVGEWLITSPAPANRVDYCWRSPTTYHHE
ncbi:hypothetical protein [Calidifontibacter terrae]